MKVYMVVECDTDLPVGVYDSYREIVKKLHISLNTVYRAIQKHELIKILGKKHFVCVICIDNID